MEIQVSISKQELIAIDSKGMLVPCNHCHVETYDGLALDTLGKGNVKLPEGLTVGNRRKYLNVQGQHLTLCTNCRYNVYGGY